MCEWNFSVLDCKQLTRHFDNLVVVIGTTAWATLKSRYFRLSKPRIWNSIERCVTNKSEHMSRKRWTPQSNTHCTSSCTNWLIFLILNFWKKIENWEWWIYLSLNFNKIFTTWMFYAQKFDLLAKREYCLLFDQVVIKWLISPTNSWISYVLLTNRFNLFISNFDKKILSIEIVMVCKVYSVHLLAPLHFLVLNWIELSHK